MTNQESKPVQSSKKDKRIYWIVTTIAMALIVLPSYFVSQEYLIDSIRRLGFPPYFKLELDICKIIGAVVILVPAIPTMFKEWAYVAFGILLLSASLAHGVVDGFAKGVAPLLPLAILGVSYFFLENCIIQNNRESTTAVSLGNNGDIPRLFGTGVALSAADDESGPSSRAINVNAQRNSPPNETVRNPISMTSGQVR